MRTPDCDLQSGCVAFGQEGVYRPDEGSDPVGMRCSVAVGEALTWIGVAFAACLLALPHLTLMRIWLSRRLVLGEP